MDKKKASENLFKFMKYLSLGLMLLLIIFVGLNWQDITVENILKFTPKNPFLAALSLLLFYGLKSLSVIFPTALLYITAGKIYSLGLALLINSLGLIIILSLPFFIGRYLGHELYKNLLLKYPQLKKIEDFKENSQWFFIVLTRIFKFLPGDIVSLALGSMEINFPLYLAISFLIRMPPMLANTFLGAGIQSKNFTGFFISTAFTLIISIASGYMYYRQEKKNKKI